VRMKDFSFTGDDAASMAAILARFATFIDMNLDEAEAFEIARDFLKDNDLNLVTVDTLAKAFLTTKFNPEKHLLN